jgi:hypothetical protein
MWHRDAVAAVLALSGWLVLATKMRRLLDRSDAGEAVALLVVVTTALMVTVGYRAHLLPRPPCCGGRDEDDQAGKVVL